jgi:hypothetical protein
VAPVALTAAAHCLVLALLRMRQHDPGLMGLITRGERDLFGPPRESPARGSANGPHWLISPRESWSKLAKESQASHCRAETGVNVEAVGDSKAARPTRMIVPYATSIDQCCPHKGFGHG